MVLFEEKNKTKIYEILNDQEQKDVKVRSNISQPIDRDGVKHTHIQKVIPPRLENRGRQNRNY